MPENPCTDSLYEAYRRVTAERLAAMDNPSLRVWHLAGASHAIVAEHPQEMAALITDFLSPHN
ncbi:alpha/beta fold hydrolase [Micromonospora vinacea]|uniref:alpha/beta fold hydrolase n=1 Tax=Micromonospora vinacea TaxID=709878 RepID=UPI003D936ACF